MLSIIFFVIFIKVFVISYFWGPLKETAFFYTYSTIAQTLAASFGILGAFLLYRLQTISNHMRTIIEMIDDLTGAPNKTYRFILLTEDYDALLEKLRSYNSNQNTYSLDSYIEHRVRLNNHRKNLIKKATFAFFATVPTTLLSIILLTCIHLLCKYGAISSLFLGLVIGLTALCVSLYADLVISSLRISKKERDICEQGTPDKTH